MKKFRFLVPLFSFGLILAYAALSQSGDGSADASNLYANSSKNSVSVVHDVTRFAVVIFFFIFVPISVYFIFREKDKSGLTEEEKTKEPSDD